MDKVITDLTTNINTGSKRKLSTQVPDISSKSSNMIFADSGSSGNSGRLSEKSISDEILGETDRLTSMASNMNEMNNKYQNWVYVFYIFFTLFVIFIIMNIIIYFEYLTLQFNHYLGRLFKTSLQVTEKGVEGSMDVVSDTLHGNMHTLKDIIDKNTLKNNINNKDIILDKDNEEDNEEENEGGNEKEIQPIETDDNKSISKKGYCYIGNDRG